MEEHNYVAFRKERDLGAIITDTFKFIRLEWKPFFSYVFKIAIIPILLAVASVLYISYASSKAFSGIDVENLNTFNDENLFGNSVEIIVAVFLMMVFYLVAYVMVNIGSLYYIKSYIENKGQVNFEEIKQKVGEKFWAFVGLGILIGLIVFASMILCFFPAIYTGIVLSLASSILVFENKTVSNAIGDSFNFIKGHWWETFGISIVIGILVSILSYIFSIPVVIYQLIQGMSLLGTDDPTQMMGMFSDPVYLVLNVIANAGQFLFSSITLIATVLVYFDINEQKNASGTLNEIDGLGR
jgi:hypothetical protein|tara:strand:- start:4289 stop:5182 length:894 start_codon:yes stop_codon:yes gene_type:complete